MRDLGERISRELLPYVRNPGQYIGLETNARCGRSPATAEVGVCLAFPDAYTVGMSHLGGQILYQVLNDLPGVACDRTYCPMPDAEQRMREASVPLFGWESRMAVADFDVLGVSLSTDMGVTNVLTMLDLAGIPLAAADRGGQHPIVVGGDAMADAPEPLADFFDIFLPGDGENTLPELVEIVRRARADGAARADVLLEAARAVPSAYVPRFYEPVYEQGAFASLRRLRDDVPQYVERSHLGDLSHSPDLTAPLVPLSEAVHERVVVEIMRGCPNACRFCQAGSTRLPVRYQPVEEIVRTVREAIANTGYREVALLSLSSSDYPHLEELMNRLHDEFAERHVSVSLPSLRVGTQLRLLPALTSRVRKSGLTIAVEAASRRLRQAMRKDIGDEDILAGVRAAYEAGLRRVKLYFMAGLPGETDEDIDAIFHLCRRISQSKKEVDGHPASVDATVSWFVPKPHTPMQWEPMRDADYYFSVRRRLRELSRRTPIKFKFHRIERSILEGLIGRGDRRMGRVIRAAWESGARMDGWDEHFDYSHWQRAFEQTGVDPAAETCRCIPLDAPLPWGHIRCPRTEKFLTRENQRLHEVLGD
ncbi:MAG: TIGR03960 family B12-binding radical SAM protein [Phycisphaerae bacterium]